MERIGPKDSPRDAGPVRVRNGPPRSRWGRHRLFALVALVAVLGLFDLIYFARFLSQPVRPGSLERMPQRLSREQILSYACFTAGIQNLALMVTLLGGDWVIRKWRMGSAGPFVIFVALGLLPFALMAIALFIAMLRVNDLT